MRIGFASDIHRLVKDRKLILAGVVVPFELGEQAHSDGDVVYHAVMDSLLGALALGDIGEHFPDNDSKYTNIDSSVLVKEVVRMVKEKGYVVNNIDVSITLERPKLKDYKLKMRQNLAELLEIGVDCVSIKAGTNEGLDEIGKGLAVKAESIVLLRKE